MKRKYIIIVIGLLIISITVIAIINFQNSNSPQSKIEMLFSDNFNEGLFKETLSNEMLSRLEEDSPINIEYYAQKLSGYQIEEEIVEIKNITANTDVAKTEVVIKSITTNQKTGFVLTTLDTYIVDSVKENGEWKINNYELTKTETLTN